VVTETVFAPAVPAGVTAVMLVALVAEKDDAATPPIETALAPVKLVPVIVIVVPPAPGPLLGATAVIVGGARYVNAPTSVPVPPGAVTVTLFRPAVVDGVTAVIVVSSTTTRFVADAVPNFTDVAPVKLVPVMVTGRPPVVGPWFGATDETVGGSAYRYPPNLVAVPHGPVTTTSFTPAVEAGAVAVIFDVLVIVNDVTGTPPIVTDVVPRKPEPLIVTVLPPATGPAVGEIVVIAGGAKYVKPLATVSVPPGVVTDTLFAPAVADGVIAVIVVSLTTTTPVADAVPNFTDVAPVKLVPLIVTAVPPAVGPWFGEIVEIAGGSTYV
jgi:hypothetical protein